MLVESLIETNAPVNAAPPPQDGFRDALLASQRINWCVDDIINDDKKLDFSKPFLPESLARVDELAFLNADEKRILNQIRGHAYLVIFGLVEEFILPFVLDHVRPQLNSDDYRVRAFLQFASEEAKHIQLFKRFHEEFRKGFATDCAVIGPAAEVAAFVLARQPLAVAITILHIEWMTQRHYVESIKDNYQLDAQFKSLLRHHWMEEAQHAKLDALMVEALADGMSAEEIEKAVDEYLEIGAFLENGLKQQARFDLKAFEKATGRKLSDGERAEFVRIQEQANRWTYLGSGMAHPNFLATLGKLNPESKKRLEQIATVFC
jgi:hypothetical protein